MRHGHRSQSPGTIIGPDGALYFCEFDTGYVVAWTCRRGS
jgi:hypothetical protein